jgi:hypothetical protein
MEAMTPAAAAVVASTSAKAANAAGSDSAWADRAGHERRGQTAQRAEQQGGEASPTTGPAADSRAAIANPHRTIGPAPTPVKAKPATLAAKLSCTLTSAKPAAAIANEAMIMRRSLTRRRIASALKRSAAWQAEEIAATAVYLASDESAFATGQAFIVDGGFAL